ncbi:MAG: DUF1549 domain-containing protein [Planctomycetaceae bacterium]|nr:DUF1549 domain-containing protein [Planctomycetales bacterium]MCB9874656.1 DUF1549 domain-containing protein [Planctomycetaceae bacterium]MCB9936854.1 DUF1549 domain-containing protein [Planctomycetaceae bacterium]HRX78334.1 DUF1549 and DUF1553 domain-containing protein [Pirellulaceae bacterium]
MRYRMTSSIALAFCCLFTSLVAAEEVAPAKIHVYPADVQLTTNRDRQSLIVQAEYADGITRDVTAEAKFTLANAALASVEANVLRPLADGASELKVEYGGHAVTVPVEVQNATVDRPISFKLDVMPVFMKSGCNTGSCHGAARGKDGFRLSLFGFDPDGDYDRLTREISGRRINLAIPEESLLVEKSVGAVPHTGGKRFDMDSEYNESLLRWLRARAPKDQGELPQVVSVEVYPKGAVLDGEGATQQINVRAKYSDGTDRDITSLAYFSSNNDNSAVIEQNGVVTAQKRGEAFIMARFDTHTVGTHFIVLPKGLQFEWKDVVANNYIDELMQDKFKKLRIQPSEVCTDEEFLRRVTIDITGALPTVEEYYAFMQDADANKRDKVVDDLLSRKEFVELWVMKWAELLQIRTTQQITTKPMLRFYNWVQERIASNMPMDQLVQELLGASGGTFANAATNYYQMESDPNKVAENVAQVFMGMRMQCAQCHNHPFDRWTMDDYYSFAAFFSQIGRKASEDPREQIIFNRASGDVKHPVDGRVMAPKFLGGEVADVAGKDRRVVMANWMASADNPYFATNLANIVWNHFLGRGIINEVDDVRVSNPPVNPELLTTLGQKFTEYNYDFKKLVRDICTSKTYQLGTQTNETNKSDDRNFSHASIRRLRAEVLLDAISQVTDTKNKFPGLPTGARAVQIVDGNTSNYFLTTFGRASRESVCACEVKMEPNLSQALHLLNGDTLQSKIQEGKLIETRLKEKVAPPQIIEEIYIRCLTRKPLESEMKELLAVLEQEKDDKRVLEDVFWALLNSREFVFNH